MGKYAGLTEFLASNDDDVVELTLEEMDDLVDGLPPSARKFPAWWGNSSLPSHQARHWLSAGRKARPELKAGVVHFRRAEDDPVAKVPRRPRQQKAEPLEVHTRRPVVLAATGEITRATVLFEWMSAGELFLDGDRLEMPLLEGRPGVYAFRITSGGTKSTFLGESENLSRRMNDYRHPGASQVNDVRLNEVIAKSLATGGTVHLEVVVAALVGGEAVDMEQRAARLVVENVALSQLHARGDAVETL